VLEEAISQTKQCYSPTIKHFDPSGLRHCDEQSLTDLSSMDQSLNTHLFE